MADGMIVASNAYPDTFVVEMATALGSLVIHVSVPATDEGGQELSPERRTEVARLRARAMANELLTNTAPPAGVNFLN